MYVTIESLFCSYCDEVAEIFLRLIDTILLASDENELRQGIEILKTKVLFDDYFVYGFGAHHFLVHQRKVSDPTQQFRNRLLKAEF